jgi:MFS transporter, DHA2 family, multidrug resistance protein
MATAETVDIRPLKPAEDTISPVRLIAFFAMVFGMFMAILDIQIVSASLAEIQAGLSASNSEISWVQTSYLIAEVIMIPLSGFLGRLLSTRVLFSVCAAGFTIASAMAATSSSIGEMIVYRAIQGFIGGGMIPSVFASAFTIFPPSKRNIISPIIGLVATMAPTIGPTVGGYISHALSWHWLFLINVVPGIIVTITTWRLIDFDEGDPSLFAKFDWWGLIGMGTFLGCLEYVLEEGPTNDWLQDQTIFNLTIILILGGLVFFWRAFTAEEPIVDLRAFANGNFAIGSIFSFVMGIGLYGLTYLYPLYLGRIRGYDSMMIGETVFISGLSMFVAAPITGILSRKMDPRLMMVLGFLGFATGTWILSDITKDWEFRELLIPQLLRGFSMMMCMVPINILALGTLPPERIKNGSGLYNLTRNLGGAFGLAIINSILVNRNSFHYERLAEHVRQGNNASEFMFSNLSARFSALGMDGNSIAISKMAGMTRQQASVMSFGDVFIILTLLFASLAILAMFMKKPAPMGSGAGGGH